MKPEIRHLIAQGWRGSQYGEGFPFCRPTNKGYVYIWRDSVMVTEDLVSNKRMFDADSLDEALMIAEQCAAEHGGWASWSNAESGGQE